MLLRGEQQPFQTVLHGDKRALCHQLFHPDFVEGIRARLVDKSDDPHWVPVDPSYLDKALHEDVPDFSLPFEEGGYDDAAAAGRGSRWCLPSRHDIVTKHKEGLTWQDQVAYWTLAKGAKPGLKAKVKKEIELL